MSDPVVYSRDRRVREELVTLREKLAARGAAALSCAELLALVLGQLPAAVLRRQPPRKLADQDPAAWSRQPGVGPATAARLCAAVELGRRAAAPEDPAARPRVNSPRQAYRQVRYLERARKEHLVGLYLDAQNGLEHRETISIGSLNITRAHPREILYPAVSHLALGFVLAHNHPSGSLEPSAEDIEFTRQVRSAAATLGIELYDHLIVARGGYTSLRERGHFRHGHQERRASGLLQSRPDEPEG